MKKIFLSLLVGFGALFASNIEIKDSYARATAPNLPNSAAFMTIVNNTNKDIALVKASTDVAKVVELHTHTKKDGMMKMIQIPKIDIPAKGKTILKSGGLHIMLINLKKALKIGEEVKLTLSFSNDETKTIIVPIKAVMKEMNHQMMKHHHHDGMKN